MAAGRNIRAGILVLAVLVPLAIGGVMARPAGAQSGTTCTWSGASGQNTFWSNGANWSGTGCSSAGGPPSGATIIFPANAPANVTFDTAAATELGEIEIDGSYSIGVENGAGPIQLTGGTTVCGDSATDLVLCQTGSGTSTTFLPAIDLVPGSGTASEVASEAGDTLTLDGVVSGATTSDTLTVNDASTSGTVVLTTADSYAGGTSVAGGILEVESTGALGSGPVSVSSSTDSSAVVEMNGIGASPGVSNSLTLTGSGTSALVSTTFESGDTWSGSVSLAGSGTDVLAASTLGNLTVSGAVTGGAVSVGGTVGSLGKLSGPVTLSGPNTYSGATTVSAGTLTGSGTVTNTSVDEGAAVSPVALTVDNSGTGTAFGLASGSVMSVAVTSSTNGKVDVENSGGTVSLGNATLVVNVEEGYSGPTGTVLDILENHTGNAISGTFGGLPEGSTLASGGRVFTISYVGGTTGHDVTLTDDGPAAEIEGTVTEQANGAPLQGICVEVTTGSSGSGSGSGPTTGSGSGSVGLAGDAFTQADGSYEVQNLTAGSYEVGFSGGCGASGTWEDQWYDGQTSETDATTVTLTNGQTKTGIDAAMVQEQAGSTPTVTGISPTSGSTSGGTTVTITGSGLQTAGQVTVVDFGGHPAGDVSCSSAQQCTAVSPAGSGTVDVIVSVDGQSSSATSADEFTYTGTEPTVTSLDPSTGPGAGGTSVSIAGSGFSTTAGATIVDFGSNQSSDVTCTSTTVCTAVSPAGAAGTVQVTVTVNGLTSPFGSGSEFTYSGPSVSSVSPDSGPTTGGTTVTVQGTDFSTAQGGTEIDFGTGNPSSDVSCSSTTTCTATSPATNSTGAVAVTVTTAAGTSAVTSASYFTYVTPPPTVTGLSPTSGPVDGGTSVTITGTSFSTIPGTTTVSFGSTAATNVSCPSTTSCTVLTPAEPAGTVDVTVTTSSGGTSATSPADQFTFVIPVPTVTSVSPVSAPADAPPSIEVDGSGFDFAQAVYFCPTGAGSLTDCTQVSFEPGDDTTLTVPGWDAPSGTGVVDIRVASSSGASAVSPADQFTYLPIVSYVYPAAGAAAGGTVVDIDGVDLSSVTSVDFGNAAGTNLVHINESSLEVTTPAGTGVVDLTVEASGTPNTRPDAFSYAPQLTGINPGLGPPAGGSTVTLYGCNLGGTTAVSFGGTPATGIGTPSEDGTCGTTGVPFYSVTVTAPAGSGSADVSLTTAGGTSVLSGAWSWAPDPYDIYPSSGPTTGGNTVQIFGYNLAQVESVTFGGAAVSNLQYTNLGSEDELTMTAPPDPGGTQAAGAVPVVLTGTGGQTTLETPYGPADAYTYATFGFITGLVEDTNGDPIPGATVQACDNGVYDCSSVTTDSDGSYSITGQDGLGLPDGTYTLTESPPAHTVAAAPAETVVVTGTNTTTAPPFVQQALLPVPTGVTINWTAGSSFTNTTPPVVYWTSETYLTATGCPSGTATWTASGTNELTGLPDSVSGTMEETPIGSGTYATYLPGFAPIHGLITLTISIECPVEGGAGGAHNAPTTQDMNIYVDPSGTVEAPDGTPISGATVTLLEASSPAGPFSAVADGSSIMSPANRQNPGVTDSTGTFGWDVLSGFYEIEAQKSGCVSTTTGGSAAYSPVLQVPPPVSGLVLELTCTGGALEATTTALSTSGTPSTEGDSTSLVATVSGSSPSGTVDFLDGTTSLGSAPVDPANGTASLITDSLAVGNHPITAEYSGDAANAPSTSNVLTQAVAPPAAPTVTSVDPQSGPAAGGTSVDIVGTGFVSGSTVDFGGVPATGVTVNNPDWITATSPAGTGTVDVTVTTPSGTSATSSADQFAYSAGGVVTVSQPGHGGSGSGTGTGTGTGQPTGGTPGAPTTPGSGGSPTVPGVPGPSAGAGTGYLVAARDGGVISFGDAVGYGSAEGMHLAAPVVGMAATPDGKGYWLVAADGGVFSFGDAGYHGSEAGHHLAAPIVGMAATPDGKGYWLVAADGGVFSFGDAGYHGSAGAERLAAPIVGMAATPDGKGYWLVAADGGVFSFGDAVYHDSAGAKRLNKPIVGMAATPDGKGYWLVAADGGVFSFGDAAYHGSTGGTRLTAPVVGMAATPDGGGYWLVAADGGVFSFGDAVFRGAATSLHPSGPVVGLAAT